MLRHPYDIMTSMIISWLGNACLRFQTGDTVVAANPPAKGSTIKVNPFGADIALISSFASEYGGAETVSYGGKEPFVIDGPGEYEVCEIDVTGYQTSGPEGLIQTAYVFTFDSLRVAVLGALSGDVPGELREALNRIDILVVPIGGGELLDAEHAAKLAKACGAKAVIPVSYGEKSHDKDALDRFLKALGTTHTEALEKFTVKARDLAGKEVMPVVLSR
jgi:L-ascorbate metabolism protein UlaG (beta-lactamase superfamily)